MGNAAKGLSNFSRRGISLVEVLVTLAIVTILIAIAVPQYIYFATRSRRTAGLVLLDRAHHAQTSYTSAHDRYLKICGVDFFCTTTEAETAEINRTLGLEPELFSKSGYEGSWNYLPGETNYEFRLSADIVPGNGNFKDRLIIGADSNTLHICKPCGFKNGIAAILFDDFKRVNNCLCGTVD